jgi:hypothetical protein
MHSVLWLQVSAKCGPAIAESVARVDVMLE